MTQTKLAEMSGVNIVVIQKYENGMRDINKSTLLNLARLSVALRCSITDLINDPELIGLLNQARL